MRRRLHERRQHDDGIVYQRRYQLLNAADRCRGQRMERQHIWFGGFYRNRQWGAFGHARRRAGNGGCLAILRIFLVWRINWRRALHRRFRHDGIGVVEGCGKPWHLVELCRRPGCPQQDRLNECDGQRYRHVQFIGDNLQRSSDLGKSTRGIGAGIRKLDVCDGVVYEFGICVGHFLWNGD